MTQEFALQLSDIRLLQTLRLLESAMDDHPDQTAVGEALEAIGVARGFINGLSGDLPTDYRPNSTVGAAQKWPAA